MSPKSLVNEILPNMEEREMTNFFGIETNEIFKDCVPHFESENSYNNGDY